MAKRGASGWGWRCWKIGPSCRRGADATFGTGGLVTTHLGATDSSNDFAADFFTTNSGKIVVAGETITTPADATSPQGSLAVASYNSDGSLDTTFGTNGKMIAAFPGTIFYGMVLQATSPDTELIVAGYVNDPSDGGSSFILARYINGVLDPTFGTNGAVVTPFSASPLSAQANTVALAPNGDIVAAGYAGNNFALARYTSDGVLDATFGTGGLVTTNFGTLDVSTINDVIVQPDGKIIAVGSDNWDFAVARYNTDGSLDYTFGVGGKLTMTLGGAVGGGAASVALQQDGDIIVGGNTGGATASYALTHLTSSGSPTDPRHSARSAQSSHQLQQWQFGHCSGDTATGWQNPGGRLIGGSWGTARFRPGTL